jgi:deoxyribodipyrimidine photolyase-related protein
MEVATIVFPHQLFETHPAIATNRQVILVEEQLFFRQFAFHRQKIALHRASMRVYAASLQAAGYNVRYVESHAEEADIRKLIPQLHAAGLRSLHVCNPVDDWLTRRIVHTTATLGIALQQWDTPMFLNTEEALATYFKGRKRMYQTDFYIAQRQQRGLLLEPDGSALGGRWSFDTDNRARYPKGQRPPAVQLPATNADWAEAVAYTELYFPNNPGELPVQPRYPFTHADARSWLSDFLHHRFAEFGVYEDALVAEEAILHHSVLTPMLNIGLLTPEEVIQAAIHHAQTHTIPLNSLEGFVRQVLGWREFIRAVYLLRGREERTRNFWGFHRPLPAAYWTGETGIHPVDHVIRKVLATGYCHHIERLMVLGNWMLLNEFDPDAVYEWFMALFIDAYDWVMVPNVYGMSQFADGGMMSTKPYISGSNYLIKMGDFTKGSWQTTWDGLFWRFMHLQRAFFSRNPRLGMLLATLDKMDAGKRAGHFQAADVWLHGSAALE